MCKCLTTAGDELDNMVLMICDHRPDCPEFKIDKHAFAANVRAEAEKIAERVLISEMPKLKAMYVPKKPKEMPAVCEEKVQLALFNYLNRKGHKIIAPNIDMFYTGEMDVCSMMKSGLINEYEIKLSRKDFFRDFKKECKHPAFEKLLKGITFETRTGYSGKRTWEIPYTSPNFFYFVTPKNLVKSEEVPDYAGLIIFDRESIYNLRTVKKAKKIHAAPLSPEKLTMLAHKLMWRVWTARDKIDDLKTKLGKNQFKELTDNNY